MMTTGGIQKPFRGRGKDLVHLVCLVCLVYLVNLGRRTRETRQTRAPDRLPLNRPHLTQGSHKTAVTFGARHRNGLN